MVRLFHLDLKARHQGSVYFYPFVQGCCIGLTILSQTPLFIYLEFIFVYCPSLNSEGSEQFATNKIQLKPHTLQSMETSILLQRMGTSSILWKGWRLQSCGVRFTSVF